VRSGAAAGRDRVAALEELVRFPLLHDRVTGTGDDASSGGLQLRQIASGHAFHVASSLTMLYCWNFLRTLALPASAMAFSILERTPSAGVADTSPVARALKPSARLLHPVYSGVPSSAMSQNSPAITCKPSWMIGSSACSSGACCAQDA